MSNAIDMRGTEVVQRPAKPISLPPAPINGGRLDERTPAKVGDWAWQPKVDDWRGVAHTPTRTVWNQYGEPSSLAEAEKIEAALTTLQAYPALEWLDVGIMEARHDMMRGCIIVFDVMVGRLTYRERRAMLEKFFPIMPLASAMLMPNRSEPIRDTVYLINQWTDASHPDPLKLQDTLLIENELLGRKFYEGLVAKNMESRYPIACNRPKTRFTGWIKHRFDQ